MTKRRDSHSVFGRRPAFPTTCWTGIGDPASHKALRAELYRQYWEPLYCYARRRGLTREDAQDVTQGFLTEILLGREFLGRADRTRGRFRSLLIKAFQNYIGSILRKKKVCSTGTEADVSEYEMPDVVPHDPGAAFDYVWASRVLDEVLADLESECARDGLQPHWGVFHERVVKPTFGGQAALSMEEICRKYAVSSEAQASNMIVTVKRRFRRILVRHLTCRSNMQDEAEEVLNDFVGIFTQSQPY